ncbi:MAG: hypothetical protein BM564_04760 [Bacteroidetes bacterium MedPE-SWsnd-G2]|nr:MAG: hypothetical protein BM564_04760 [Bacteroidetes bacterium MedPE-SWsnd-G2]
MKNFQFIILILCTYFVSGQNANYYSDYNWTENPNYNVDQSQDASIIGLKDNIVTEFSFTEEGELTEYFLEHKTLWLNSDEKIEDYNKIYLPYNSTSKLLKNKARVITKEGKIIELNDSKIFTAEDEETGRKYKYYAFEGIEKGSIIEYFYVVQRTPSYTGSRITFQGSFEKNDFNFELFAPSNLEFAFKSYNNLPNIVRDTVNTDKNHWSINVPKLEALEKESQAAYHANKAMLVYKLDRNTANNYRDISSYNKVSQNIYNYYYEELTKKTLNELKKLSNTILNKKEINQTETIRAIELYLKTNFYIAGSSNSQLTDISEVIKNKVASEAGILKLYVALLKLHNIKHEIVLTSNRQDLKFDETFEAHNFLNEFLIYFPKQKSYLSPTSEEYRYGFPPPYLTDNFGLFIKEITVGEFSSGVGKIKYINPVQASKTFDKLNIKVEFDSNDISISKVQIKKQMGGYYALYIQPFANLMKDKDKEEIIESYAHNISEMIELESKLMKNDDPTLFGIEPLILDFSFNSDTFVEKAGTKYLFKVGELIGKQMQMYQEKERTLPLEAEFQRSYNHSISIKIPDGYNIANLEDLKINNDLNQGDNAILSFKSDYRINGQILEITIKEFYKENIIGLDKYESYRKVINSAADFNKVTLILTPTDTK